MMNAAHSGYKSGVKAGPIGGPIGGAIYGAICGAICGAIIGAVGKSNIPVAAMILAARGAASGLLPLISSKVFENKKVAVVANFLSDAVLTMLTIVALRRFDIIGNRGTVVFGFFAGCALVTAGIAGYAALRLSQNPEEPPQEPIVS